MKDILNGLRKEILSKVKKLLPRLHKHIKINCLIDNQELDINYNYMRLTETDDVTNSNIHNL